MSAPIDDGGPAFPFGRVSELTGQLINGFFNPGMTLRDYFAAAALPQVDQRSHGNLDEIALECYQIADAMLKAREAK